MQAGQTILVTFFPVLIKVPENGVYTFQTSSDDGSVLYIDNELVVNNDGSHAAIPATGFIALEKVSIPISSITLKIMKEKHFELGFGNCLSAETLVPIPSSVLYVGIIKYIVMKKSFYCFYLLG